ncbi:MAG: hypothetical protein GPJ13_02795 [Microcystis aeruginosa W11-06]|jgi:hypothetical protein|nr:hypothetical protein [Microcystis aeruginosa W11-03]NCR92734.1 hypothetical protein [Microcystis aeruginosa W11-06]
MPKALRSQYARLVYLDSLTPVGDYSPLCHHISVVNLTPSPLTIEKKLHQEGNNFQ